MDAHERLHVETLRKCLLSLEETIGRLHFLTVEMPRDEAWDKVRDEVSCLDSIGDVTRQALDAIERKA